MKTFLKFATVGLAFTAVPILARADEISQVRDVPSFSRVVIESSADANIHVGKSQKVEVFADDKYIDVITTEVRNDTLYISHKRGSHRTHGRVLLEINVPGLEGVRVAGSGDFRVENLDSDSFDVDIDGSGDVWLDGSCGDLTITVDGSGDIDSRKLKCKTAVVEIDGSGDVDVYASESLDLDINGSGDTTVYGDPARVRPKIHGSGDLDYADDK